MYICNFQNFLQLRLLNQFISIRKHVEREREIDFYISSTSQASQPLMKCRKVFQALIKLAVEELCETADSLIAPVRLGVARPTAPFTLTSSAIEVINGSEELFSIEPLIPHSGVSSQTLDAALQTQQGNNNITMSRGDVSAVDETEGGEGMKKKENVHILEF